MPDDNYARSAEPLIREAKGAANPKNRRVEFVIQE